MPGTSWTASRGRPAFSAAAASTSTSTVFDRYADAEPRSNAALPLLTARPAASTVTFGRASYTIATTPIGTRIWRISSPFGRV